MTRYEAIYEAHAERYDELVRHEDVHGNVAKALAARMGGSRPTLAVELGAGTGRITRVLAASCERVHAYDRSAHMLAYAERAVGASNVTYAAAENVAIPERDLCADIVVAGWTFGHAIGAHPQGWEKIIEDTLHEMMRLVAPRGHAVIFETLGTCVDAPAPPNAALGAYYTLLERWYGFTREVIATDYAFDTAADAERVLGFFFGEEMQARVKARGTRTIPELTGVWTRSQTRT